MKFVKIEPNKYDLHHIYITSGDEDRPGCRLMIASWKWYITVRLPQIIRPHRVKVQAGWDAGTIKRLGRDWYWRITEREFGISHHENHVTFRYGIQTSDSSTEKSWGFFLPWNEWRMVRFSLYGIQGEHFWSQNGEAKGMAAFEEQMAKEAECPSVTFSFKDFDGEEIEARTHIEEREWHRGEKWCKWISFFSKPKVRRYLEIKFSEETGPRKGSWKGGTIGHAIEMAPMDLHMSAFMRYCREHNMTFVGQVEEKAA